MAITFPRLYAKLSGIPITTPLARVPMDSEFFKKGIEFPSFFLLYSFVLKLRIWLARVLFFNIFPHVLVAYYLKLSTLNQITTMAKQINEDVVSLNNHKYITHQMALLHVRYHFLIFVVSGYYFTTTFLIFGVCEYINIRSGIDGLILSPLDLNILQRGFCSGDYLLLTRFFFAAMSLLGG